MGCSDSGQPGRGASRCWAPAHPDRTAGTSKPRSALALSQLAVGRGSGVVVLEVEDRPGVLADLTLEAARAGIDLDLVYVATRTGSSSSRRSRQVEGRAGAGVALPAAVRRRRRPRLGRLVVHRRAGDDVLQPEDAVQPAALVDHAAPGYRLTSFVSGGSTSAASSARALADSSPRRRQPGGCSRARGAPQGANGRSFG